MQLPAIEKIVASPKLPSLPAAAVKIIELVQDPEVNLRVLSNVISSDAALTSKILKQANSAFYGRARGVSTLSEALMLLGLRRVKTLALGFSLIDQSRNDPGGFDYPAFWRRSLFAAVGARAMASRMRSVDNEEAFLGGLMHGIGVLALNQAIGRDYQELFAKARGDYGELLSLESEAMGFHHAEVGGLLAERWNLPHQLTAALRWLAMPGYADERTRPLVLCVSAGSAAADIFSCDTPGLAVVRYRDRCHQWFGLGMDESDKMLAQIQADAADLRPLLDLPEVDEMSVSEILSQAIEALEALSFEAESENAQLEKEKSLLAVEASTDALTGLANRRGLLDFLAAAVADSVAFQRPLCYLMVDIDQFKRVNDVYGHPAGDVVLCEVAAVLRAWCRDVDLVGRSGGDELGVVATDTNLAGAVRLAQRLRQAIEGMAISLDSGESVNVTLSIGIATVDPAWHAPVEQLIAAADSALYDAKQSGRNAVRIAKPAAA